MPIFNHFDFLAPFYDRFIKHHDLTRFNNYLGLPISGKLLDAAGGTGGKSYSLLEVAEGIVIADSSMGMLFQAARKGNFITVCSETERLPFKDESFERVIMVDALHHVSDYRATSGELWRVVKPGGRIVVEEPDIHKIPIKILAMIEKLALMRSHFISPQEIAATFSYPNAGVKIEVKDTIAWILIDKHAGD